MMAAVWSEQERESLRDMAAARITHVRMAVRLKRSLRAVREQMRRMGLDG